jgi:hypothetical protein
VTKVNMEITADDVEASKGDGEFVLPPVGFYTATIKSCDAGFSKTDGEEDKSKPRLQVVWTIVGVGREDEKPDANYGQIWDYVSMSAAAGWKRVEFLQATNQDATPGKKSFDTDDVVGVKALIRIKHENGQNKGDPKRAKIAKLFPWSEDGASPAASSPADESDAFASDDFEAGAEEFLTREFLETNVLKDLGVIAKEFDLDPNTLVVKKGKAVDQAATKEAVIAAILEAQGDTDNGSEDDDEESPF